MTKKTLEEKIKLVCWWALGLTILYFLIGAWLISDGSKFDPTKTYNLIKDTLSLTAAFLAPVAAFVLFTDWRTEHREKIKDTNIRELIEGYSNLFKEAYELNYKINISNDYQKNDVIEIQALLDSYLKNIMGMQIYTENLKAQSPDLDNLITQLNEILRDFINMGVSMGFNFQHYKIVYFPEDPEFKELYLESETKEDFILRHYREIGGHDPDSQDEDLYNIKVKFGKQSELIAIHLI